MTAGIVAIFPDVRAEVCTVLRAALAGRAEPYAAGVTVGARVPAGPDLDTDRLPFVLVAVDGTPDTVYPVVARSTVRVTVWHIDDEQAHDLAQLAQGLLCAATGDRLASCVPLTGPLAAVDPDSGLDLASFTVRASTCGVPA